MTEVERIRYAKMFVDKMANGIDPLTDLPVPEEELINHVRISRCLFYVSDILRQVAEQGGVSGGKKRAKEAFFLDHESRRKFPFSDDPIPVSELVKRINSLTETENMKKLTHRHVTQWLLSLGALEEVSDLDGEKAKRPTRKGEELGIRATERQGKDGAYVVLVYDRDAQQFLLDNLDGVIELAAKKEEERASSREMQGQPWTRPQEELLAELFARRVPLTEIAATLKRSPNGVKLRLERLGLAEPGSSLR